MIALTREAVKAIHSEPITGWDAWLLQCNLGGCPWRVAVCSILLQRTKRTQMESTLVHILGRWPTPMDLALADSEVLQTLLRPLGLYKTRARQLIRFSAEFLEDNWNDLRDLPGVGPYVADAVGLVCFGCTDLESADHALTAYARKLDRESIAAYRDYGGEG